MSLDAIPVHSVFRSGQPSLVYNEAAFRHFLAVEHARVRQTQRCFYLVLVAIRRSPGRPVKLSNGRAIGLFRALTASVREVDFVGWYHEGLIAAAGLTQGLKPSNGDAALRIAERVHREMNKHLRTGESNQLRVRVIRLGGRPQT